MVHKLDEATRVTRGTPNWLEKPQIGKCETLRQSDLLRQIWSNHGATSSDRHAWKTAAIQGQGARFLMLLAVHGVLSSKLATAPEAHRSFSGPGSSWSARRHSMFVWDSQLCRGTAFRWNQRTHDAASNYGEHWGITVALATIHGRQSGWSKNLWSWMCAANSHWKPWRNSLFTMIHLLDELLLSLLANLVNFRASGLHSEQIWPIIEKLADN